MEYGLIGEKLGHSYSKLIHEKLGDYSYELCPLSREEFPNFMKKREFKAINVTIPYKKEVIPFLDELDEQARAIGAVNTIVQKDGKLIGHNTDFGGFLYMIQSSHISIRKKKVLVLGTGGASLAVLAVLRYLEAGEILSVSRTPKEGCITYEQCISCHTDAQVIVNTTPVGMYPHIDASPLDLTPFTKCEAVLDIVYNPSVTMLTAQAAAFGMKAVSGFSMLVAQAKYAFEFFMDIQKPDRLIPEICRDLAGQLRPAPGPVPVKNIVIGTTTPKICIPLTGRNKEELLEQIQALRQAPCDLAEWRADCFLHISDLNEVLSTLKAIKKQLGDIPLIFTFRTDREGGFSPISSIQYEVLLSTVITLGRPDLVDIEWSMEDNIRKPLLFLAEQTGVRTILSHHNFSKTPSEAEMLSILQNMDILGGHILKLAVMPSCARDVSALLSVTAEMKQRTARPLITMSMGKLGAVSRFTGSVFGSALTFGTVGKSSAPGQIPAVKLKELLSFLE